ncbi:hypothetical protein HN587_00590 [Candidatus Woesearchaeota archaeon]|nr:hypothetical protein [Candidatus Woesearchaeota archaeon]
MATKRIKKEPSKLDKAMDVADNFGDIMINYLNSRYRIRRRFEDAKKEVFEFVYSIKRSLFRTLIEATLLLTGLVAFIAGVILILQKHYPLEIVLVTYGLVVMVVIALQLKTRR